MTEPNENGTHEVVSPIPGVPASALPFPETLPASEPSSTSPMSESMQSPLRGLFKKVKPKVKAEYEGKLKQERMNTMSNVDNFVSKTRKVTVNKAAGQGLGLALAPTGAAAVVPGVLIVDLLVGGPTAATGLVNLGDQLLHVNGQSLIGLPFEKAKKIIRELSGLTTVELELATVYTAHKAANTTPTTNFKPMNADANLTSAFTNTLKFTVKKKLGAPLGVAVSPTLPGAVIPGFWVSALDTKSIEPESKDENQNLMLGDQLLSLNGQSLTGLNAKKITQLLKDCSKFTEVRVELARANKALCHQLPGGPPGMVVVDGVVKSVDEGGVADQAGFKPGQRILAIQDTCVYPETKKIKSFLKSEQLLNVWTIEPRYEDPAVANSSTTPNGSAPSTPRARRQLNEDGMSITLSPQLALNAMGDEDDEEVSPQRRHSDSQNSQLPLQPRLSDSALAPSSEPRLSSSTTRGTPDPRFDPARQATLVLPSDVPRQSLTQQPASNHDIPTVSESGHPIATPDAAELSRNSISGQQPRGSLSHESEDKLQARGSTDSTTVRRGSGIRRGSGGVPSFPGGPEPELDQAAAFGFEFQPEVPVFQEIIVLRPSESSSVAVGNVDAPRTSSTGDIPRTSITRDVPRTSITGDISRTSIAGDVPRTSITGEVVVNPNEAAENIIQNLHSNRLNRWKVEAEKQEQAELERANSLPRGSVEIPRASQTHTEVLESETRSLTPTRGSLTTVVAAVSPTVADSFGFEFQAEVQPPRDDLNIASDSFGFELPSPQPANGNETSLPKPFKAPPPPVTFSSTDSVPSVPPHPILVSNSEISSVSDLASPPARPHKPPPPPLVADLVTTSSAPVVPSPRSMFLASPEQFGPPGSSQNAPETSFASGVIPVAIPSGSRVGNESISRNSVSQVDNNERSSLSQPSSFSTPTDIMSTGSVSQVNGRNSVNQPSSFATPTDIANRSSISQMNNERSSLSQPSSFTAPISQVDNNSTSSFNQPSSFSAPISQVDNHERSSLSQPSSFASTAAVITTSPAVDAMKDDQSVLETEVDMDGEVRVGGVKQPKFKSLKPGEKDEFESKLNQTRDFTTANVDNFLSKTRSVSIPKKSKQGLGFIILPTGPQAVVPGVVVDKLLVGGPAASTGLVNIGDQVLTVNNKSLVGLPYAQAKDIIRGVKNDTMVSLELVALDVAHRPVKIAPVPHEWSSADASLAPVYTDLQKCTVNKAAGSPLSFSISPTLPGAFVPGMWVSQLGTDSGDLRLGDQIMAVDGQSLTGLSIKQVRRLFKDCTKSTQVQFDVARPVEPIHHQLQAGVDSGLAIQNGVVRGVEPGSPGDKAQFSVGERILTVQGISVYPKTKRIQTFLKGGLLLDIWSIKPRYLSASPNASASALAALRSISNAEAAAAADNDHYYHEEDEEDEGDDDDDDDEEAGEERTLADARGRALLTGSATREEEEETRRKQDGVQGLEPSTSAYTGEEKARPIIPIRKKKKHRKGPKKSGLRVNAMGVIEEGEELSEGEGDESEEEGSRRDSETASVNTLGAFAPRGSQDLGHADMDASAQGRNSLSEKRVDHQDDFGNRDSERGDRPHTPRGSQSTARNSSSTPGPVAGVTEEVVRDARFTRPEAGVAALGQNKDVGIPADSFGADASRSIHSAPSTTEPTVEVNAIVPHQSDTSLIVNNEPRDPYASGSAVAGAASVNERSNVDKIGQTDMEENDATSTIEDTSSPSSVGKKKFKKLRPRDKDAYESKLTQTRSFTTANVDNFLSKMRRVTVPKTSGQGLGIIVLPTGPQAVVPGVVVDKMMVGGPVASTGLISIGDQILTVNSKSLIGLPYSQAKDIIRDLKVDNEVVLEVVALDVAHRPVTIAPVPHEWAECDPSLAAVYDQPERCTVYKKAGTPLSLTIYPTLPGAVVPGVWISHVGPESGDLELGDHLMSVDGHSLTGLNERQVAKVLKECNKASEVHFEVVRPVHPINHQLQSGGAHGLTVDNGGVVTSVEPGSPAEQAKFVVGQRILTMQGESVFPKTKKIQSYLKSGAMLNVWSIQQQQQQRPSSSLADSGVVDGASLLSLEPSTSSYGSEVVDLSTPSTPTGYYFQEEEEDDVSNREEDDDELSPQDLAVLNEARKRAEERRRDSLLGWATTEEAERAREEASAKEKASVPVKKKRGDKRARHAKKVARLIALGSIKEGDEVSEDEGEGDDEEEEEEVGGGAYRPSRGGVMSFSIPGSDEEEDQDIIDRSENAFAGGRASVNEGSNGSVRNSVNRGSSSSGRGSSSNNSSSNNGRDSFSQRGNNQDSFSNEPIEWRLAERIDDSLPSRESSLSRSSSNGRGSHNGLSVALTPRGGQPSPISTQSPFNLAEEAKKQAARAALFSPSKDATPTNYRSSSRDPVSPLDVPPLQLIPHSGAISPRESRGGMTAYTTEHIANYRDLPCLVDSEVGVKLTYAELGTKLRTVARRLKDHGLRRGDVLLLACGYHIYNPLILHAALLLGAVVSCCNPASDMLANHLSDSRASFVCTTAQYLDEIKLALDNRTLVHSIIVLDPPHISRIFCKQLRAVLPFEGLLHPDLEEELSYADTLDAVRFLEPKAVRLTHSEMVANLKLCASELPLQQGDSVLVCLPFFQLCGQSLVNVAFRQGCTILFPPSNAPPSTILNMIKLHGVNYVVAEPSLAEELTNEIVRFSPAPGAKIVGPYDLSTLKAICGVVDRRDDDELTSPRESLDLS